MKKLLLLMMYVPVVLSAQNGVTVSGLNVNNGTVTFNVSWDRNALQLQNIVWLDSVWVFVDYNDNSVMKRLPLLPGATLTETSAPGFGKLIEEENNNKGVWVVGNAKSKDNDAGSFSATVKLYYNSETAVAGACAYALNYPPVGKYLTDQTIKFTGTSPYKLVLNTGIISVDEEYTLVGGQTLESFTDKTGAPGTITCVLPSAPNVLSSNVTQICSGVTTSATLTASGIGVGSGAMYEWGRGATVGSGEILATTSGNTYQVSTSAASTYWVRLKGAAGPCSATATGGVTTAIAVYGAISPGSITTSAATTIQGVAPSVTVSSSQDASGGSSNLAYEWRRSGTSSKSSLGSNATYALSSDASNYSTAGTYYFNRYTKDLTCANATAVAAYGTYTLIVTLSASFSTGTGGPNTAYSTKTWLIGSGSSAQTWSDHIVKAVCTNSSTLTTSSPPAAQYKIVNGLYYYNWACVSNNATTLCPTGWRVPSAADYATLIATLGGSNRTTADIIHSVWYPMGAYQGAVDVKTTEYWNWCLDVTKVFYCPTNHCSVGGTPAYMGALVRCVK